MVERYFLVYNGNMNISIGKALGISQCASPGGTFSILAFDHRNNLRTAINPSDPNTVSYDTLMGIKSEVVESLARVSSAVLLDPEYGVSGYVLETLISSKTGLILAVENTGYSGLITDRRSSLIEDWGVEKIKRMGANAVKLLIYFHPSAKSVKKQIEVVDQVSKLCVEYDLPLFLEVLTFSVDPKNKALSSEEKLTAISAAIEVFGQMPVDIFKLEFPLNINQSPERDEWEEACHKISGQVHIPWLLLSAGVDFETFLLQTEIACKSGASGVMAGRAIWKEAVELDGGVKKHFLAETAPRRMSEMTDVCRRYAKPWMGYFEFPPIHDKWFTDYKGFP